MAADVLCSELISSPRISFSHDLKDLNSPSHIEIESTSRSDAFQLNSTIDFDFHLHQNSSQHHHLSSADEIFANGKILALEIKKPEPHKTSNENTKKKRLIEYLSTSFDDDDQEQETEEKTGETEHFTRSSSLKFNNTNNKLLRSLQFLTRSNSTGSAPTQKPKALNKQHSLKEEATTSTDSAFQFYKNVPNRPYYLNKSGSSKMYGNGVRVSPVLNIPPTYITKGTVGLFGIASSLFCSKKKSKKNKNK